MPVTKDYYEHHAGIRCIDSRLLCPPLDVIIYIKCMQTQRIHNVYADPATNIDIDSLAVASASRGKGIHSSKGQQVIFTKYHIPTSPVAIRKKNSTA